MNKYTFCIVIVTINISATLMLEVTYTYIGGEMGWKPISFTTEISIFLIFNESCRLADDGLQNWVHSIRNF